MVMRSKVVQLPMLNFRAGLMPETLDAEKRTVEVTWTTGERGKRWGYYEELAIEPENVRLNRLIGGPVLDQHRGFSVRDAIGVVEDVWSVKSSNGKVKEWRARIRFSSQADDILQLVREGIAKSVSVGYLVNKYEELEERQDKLPIYRGVDWEPFEISFVNVPFDNAARVRSEDTLSSECTFILRDRSHTMEFDNEGNPIVPAPNAEKTREAPATPLSSPPVERAEIEQETRAKVMRDLADVKRSAQALGFGEVEVRKFEDMIGAGKTIEQIRGEMVIEKCRNQPKIDNTSSKVTVGANLLVDGVERGIIEMLLARSIPSEYAAQVTDAGKGFQRDSVLRMAERLLEAHGRNTNGLSKQRLLSEAIQFRSGSHSTSDFYHLFQSSVSRVLQDEFNKVKQTYTPLAHNVELPDFRDAHYVTVGDNFSLERKDENDEIKYGTFTADSRSFRLFTWARGIVWTREMMINDDLSVLSRLPSMVSRAGGKLRSRLVWGMIVGDGEKIGPSGIVMSDGNPLFASVHNNLATQGSGINKVSVAAARKAIRKQRAFGDKQGADTLDLEPRYLVVGPECEQEANDFLASSFVAVNQADAAAHNLTRSLTLIVENRITNNAWYLVSTDIDGIVTATLQGEDGMYLESEQNFDTDGYKLKGRLDFGTTMARWEGWYKNPGV